MKRAKNNLERELRSKKFKDNLFSSLISIIGFSIVLIVVCYFLLSQYKTIGLVLVFFGIIGIIFLKLITKRFIVLVADLTYGFVNGTLTTIIALIGAGIGGVLGAVVGALIGNAITDGIGGMFEGEVAELLKKKGLHEERTPLTTALSKMVGNLTGSGIVLVFAWTILSLF